MKNVRVETDLDKIFLIYIYCKKLKLLTATAVLIRVTKICCLYCKKLKFSTATAVFIRVTKIWCLQYIYTPLANSPNKF